MSERFYFCVCSGACKMKQEKGDKVENSEQSKRYRMSERFSHFLHVCKLIFHPLNFVVV